MPSKNYADFDKSHRPPPPGATRLGDTPADEVITVSVYLKPRPAPQEGELAGGPVEKRAARRVRRSAEHHDDIRILSEFAAENGLNVTQIEPGRHLVKLTGTAAKIASAFGTRLSTYEHGGRRFRGREGVLRLPDDVLPIVSAVFGLDTRPAAHPNSNQVSAAAGGTSHLPNEVGRLYNFPTGVSGAGQCVALVELGGGYNLTDINQSFSNMGLTPPQVVSVSVDGAANSPGSPDDGEVALDIQVAGGVAPGARIAVYFAPNSTAGFVDAVSAAVHDTANAPSVISISWGSTETNYSQQFRDQMDLVFQDAQTLRVSVFVASGDHLGTDANTDGQVHVQYPASSPYAIGCGGTLIQTSGTAITSESVWNDGASLWGTGGGISSVYMPAPAFQAGANLPKNVSTGLGGRGVPDVAGDGASGSGYQIVLNNTQQVWYGTSAVAPLWAGLTALINEHAAEHVGFFLPFLYNNAGLLRDITQGNNIPPGNNLGYPACPGWDACTGLGSPDGVKLRDALVGVQLDHSRWNTVYQSPSGPVPAIVTFNQAVGQYQLVNSAGQVTVTGQLSGVQYNVSTPAVWTIHGQWSLAGDSGIFQFQASGGPNDFVGTWSSAQLGSGWWNGHRI